MQYLADNGTQFEYTLGHTGAVEIVDGKNGERVSVPVKDILEFVANTYVRPVKKQILENASPEEVLLPSHDVLGHAINS